MPRLRHAVTGVVVDVSDATAARLGPEYRSVEAKAEPEPKRPRRKAAKTDDEQ